MSYVALTDAEIASGQPVSNPVMDKIKENFENHEDRIVDVENGINIDYPALTFRVSGPYSNIGVPARTGYLKTTNNFSFRITGVRLLIDVAGAANLTEIDIQKKSGVGAYSSVLTTRPSVGFAAGSDAISSNGVVDASNDEVLAGDILRLDITSAQTGNESGFLVRIDYVRI